MTKRSKEKGKIMQEIQKQMTEKVIPNKTKEIPREEKHKKNLDDE